MTTNEKATPKLTAAQRRRLAALVETGDDRSRIFRNRLYDATAHKRKDGKRGGRR